MPGHRTARWGSGTSPPTAPTPCRVRCSWSKANCLSNPSLQAKVAPAVPPSGWGIRSGPGRSVDSDIGLDHHPMASTTTARGKRDTETATTASVDGKRGIDVLHDPVLNKATAYTEAERQALGLVGLV